MARPRKAVEIPGQESSQAQGVELPDTDGTETNTGTEAITGTEIAAGDDSFIQQNVAALLDGTALTERNSILSTINEQGAAIIARFEEYAFTDIADQSLTDNLDFLNLVRKATETTTASTGPTVTNEEGKRQPVAGKPVLTEHGWHVPG